ncbi:MAG: SAM-dependent chlorinase/fluorinase [Nitrospirota bacterium]|nr:MAG: SAM-dependent chlorinase/fluorinase [Nitrospirota bacterium]
MPTAISLVTLLTDFGDRDYFVPSMKGVMLGINPQLRILDLSHQIPAQNIEQAAFFLKSCYRYFPDGTVHVVVVDPGVGSPRRPLLVSTSRYFFIAPDNGVLNEIFDEEVSVEVRVIENKQYRLDAEGATFDGRDLFAPAAAWLTKGQTPGSYGRLIRDAVRLPKDEPQMDGEKLVGKIVYIDHFGNLISNITPTDLQTFRSVAKRDIQAVQLGGIIINGIKSHYAEGALGLPEALINSNGQLEIFIKQGSAVDRCEATIGQRIELR